jgi:hypothetical protein
MGRSLCSAGGEVSAKGLTRWTYKSSRLPTELVEHTDNIYNQSIIEAQCWAQVYSGKPWQVGTQVLPGI